ncbi:MAG TPA: VWA domain-containing protein, partial [Gemmataceae bacterium]|nr:VWA domain-containing protein [Gemmataceae bacterium]
RLGFTVDVYPSELPVSDFRSALHVVLQAVSDSGVRRILLQSGERLNRDFILRFRVGDEAVRTALTLAPDSTGAQEGTFALTLVPPTGAAQKARPRDVIFVLDRSGSMGGWKIAAARRALGHMVDTLTERDRFTVYAFDDAIEKPPTFPDLGLQPATDRNRFRAAEFLGGVEARGGTEMAQPLSMAAHLLASGGQAQRDKVLVLITDGQVGNEDQILQSLTRDLKSVRVFALGIDQAVNAAFLRRLADLGGGVCELVESEKRLGEVLQHIHRRIGTPLLTKVFVEGAGLDIDDTTFVPTYDPDLFAGTPVFILGRYRGAAEGSIRVMATDAAGAAWSQTVAGGAVNGGAITSVWARGYIRDLEDYFVSHTGDLRVVERRIVETSLKYGVLCRFTAFLAVDRTEAPNVGGERAQILQPVESPQGWDQAPQAPRGHGSFGGARMTLSGATPPMDRTLGGMPAVDAPDYATIARGGTERSMPPPAAMAPQPVSRAGDTAVMRAVHKKQGMKGGRPPGRPSSGWLVWLVLLAIVLGGLGLLAWLRGW